ncbi:MAG TPA: OmpA family protein [Thermoanaerobaculia bacterium]|nr:OmpA family protein [Thermoanaerobaculia bacterium]
MGSTPLFAQMDETVEISRDDQLRFFAPTHSGQTGLFETVTADTLRRGQWSFGVYFNDWDLTAGEAREFAPLSAREYQDLSYDHYRLSGSIGVGITDRWEVSAMIPWDRLVSNGGDRAGFINGHLFRGEFTESGLGPIRLATKFGLTPNESPTRFALSGFVDLPTGEDGISSGGTDFGIGGHVTRGIGSASLKYVMRGDHEDDDIIGGLGDVSIPNELRLDAGLNIPISMFGTTNWVNEINTVIYTGGDRAPDTPVFLVSGFRHWFGTSGWSLSAGARWNVAKFMDNNDECRFTELDDCGLSGLVGLTFAPLLFTRVEAPPPPPPPALPPPEAPTQAPIPPTPPPVVTPRTPTDIRTDEIHFEAGSARLTNIAKAILDEVALRMKQEPSAQATVIGYTDDRENVGPNRDLDRRRAEAVRDYLVTRHGIDPSRITVEGRGTGEAAGDNTTAEGRLRNRRVVIRLTLP